MNNPTQRLQDIVDACNDAAAIVAQGRNGFDGDPLLIRAAKNIVSEIGEAAKAAYPLTEQIPAIPWKQIAGMRDRTIHRYPEVDLDVLWDTLATDLPELASAVRLFLGHRRG